MKTLKSASKCFEFDIESASSAESIFEIFYDNVKNFGYEHCSYKVRLPLPIANPKVFSFGAIPCCADLGNHPNLCDGDHARSFGLTKRMSTKLWPETEKIQGNNVRLGWVKAIHSRNGATGILMLGHPPENLPHEIAPNEYQAIDAMLSSMHTKVTDLLFKEYIPEASAKISARELEVLRWTSDGKTSHEIGLILGLSAATVNFHVQRLIAKMNSANKMHAVVKAVALGILNTSCDVFE